MYLHSRIIILLLTTNMKNIFMILIEISDMDKSDYLLLVNSAYLLYRIIPTSLLRVKNQFEICLEDKVEISRNYFFSQPSTISKSTIWAESNSQQLENSNKKLECWLSIYVSSFFYSRRRFSPRVAFKTLCHPLYSNVFAQGSKKREEKF